MRAVMVELIKDKYSPYDAWYIATTPKHAVGTVFIVAGRYDILFDDKRYWGANVGGLESFDEALAYVRMVCS
jgi:hypothetical protein